MEIAIRDILRPKSTSLVLFSTLALLILLSIGVSLVTEIYYFLALPVLFLMLFLVVVDFRQVYFLLIASIPLSTEIYFPGGFGTDLPVEALMVGLMGVYLLYVLRNTDKIDGRFFQHPITLLLMLHLGWVFFATLTSSLFVVSLKFFLAKLWYIVVGYFMTALIIKKEKDFRLLFWYFFSTLIFTVLVTIVRHGAYGFSFQDVYKVLHPFYRNHVAYGVIMSLFLPIVVLALRWYKRYSFKWLVLVASIVILLFAIYLSYTRAAYVSVAIAFASYFIVKWKLIRYVLLGVLIASVLGVGYFVRENTYLEYAPNFDRTITHTEFDNLIAATYNMEDISTMERVYRWVAGFVMFNEKPVVGFGPGNFVNFYRSYTVTSFKTYVSRNEQQSGIHSYFIMTMVEQGLVGLIIYLLLSFYVLIRGEDIYHKNKDPRKKTLVMMGLLCTIVIDAFCIINDLIETDKAGPFFFIVMAVIVNMDLANKRDPLSTAAPLPQT